MKIELKHCLFCNCMTNHYIKDGWQLCGKCKKKTLINPFGNFFDKPVKK